MKEIRKLTIRAFHIDKVEFADKFSVKNNTLTIQSDVAQLHPDLDSISISIIQPNQHDFAVNHIFDIIPISAKVLGEIGEGITHTLTGVYVLLTGASKDNVQITEFGCSEGILSEQLKLNKLGTPSDNDILIHIDILASKESIYNRKLCFNMFEAADLYVQPIRELLKEVEGKDATESHTYYDKVNPGKPRVVLVKEIAGQGAMYDNQLFADEPSAITGGVSIIDMNNMPVILTPNEYRDGIIHAMV